MRSPWELAEPCVSIGKGRDQGGHGFAEGTGREPVFASKGPWPPIPMSDVASLVELMKTQMKAAEERDMRMASMLDSDQAIR